MMMDEEIVKKLLHKECKILKQEKEQEETEFGPFLGQSLKL